MLYNKIKKTSTNNEVIRYIKDNIFSILALLIAFLSLIISALALILPGRCECSQVETNADARYSYQENLEDAGSYNQ